MIIKGKCYCDVCMKELQNTCDTCFVISGANLDDGHEYQERHYCNEHRVWYELWYAIRNGEDVGQLAFPNQTDKTETKEKKEVSTLELYDILSDLLKRHHNYLVDYLMKDTDVNLYYKNCLDADINFNRLKVRGELTDE